MSFADIFKPSIRLRRWWRKVKDLWSGTYYEGPTPPPRLLDEVRIFMVLYPNASKQQWMEFSTKHAANSYRSGFVRGHDWVERGWEGPPPDEDRERLLEAEMHDWSLAEESPQWERILTTGRLSEDPLAGLDAEGKQEFMNMLQGPKRGMFPVEIKLAEYDEEEEAQ